jgi:hypothetical protein
MTTKRKKNGKTNGGGRHHSVEDDVMTVTFRIPGALKRQLEETAKTRGVTSTRVVIAAIENEVTSRPPNWWVNRREERVS